MINDKLINPESIAVVGASDNLSKPGGKVLKNIIEGGFKGRLYVVNPNHDFVQGIKSFRDIEDIPNIDLAILAVSSQSCLSCVETLAYHKGVKAFIIISAGFSETSEEGGRIERTIADIIDKTGGCLIGPNCIGVITGSYHGAFISPVPKPDPWGCDFVSGSGATVFFIFESALSKGLRFANVFSVGNSAQTGVEKIVEYWDISFDPETSSKIKLIYVESIKNPDKLLRHASSLIRKGCRIAAIKAGTTEAGSRAALSHTGAMASADSAVEALFRKAGIVRCDSREELVTVASVFMHKPLKGNNIAIITQAGGPAVMLTDALSAGGMNIPKFEEIHRNRLLEEMNDGASADNPIDIIATGATAQLENVIDYVDKNIPYINGMSVIFGNNGFNDIIEVYDLLHKKIESCDKPIYPVLPSITSSSKELEYFFNKGHVNFPDEVVLGKALTKIFHTPYPAEENIFLDDINVPLIRQIIDESQSGFLEPAAIQKLLNAASIPMVKEAVATTKNDLLSHAKTMRYPLALKVVGPVHKSDVGGVALNIKSEEHLLTEFSRMMKIKDAKATVVQQMLTGTELFIGAKYEPHFGHIILCGIGGIFVEALGDVSSGLAPLTFSEAGLMIKNIKSYKIIEGTRGQPGVNIPKFTEIIVRLSSLLRFAVEIKEIDLNPLIEDAENIAVVDARIRIEK